MDIENMDLDYEVMMEEVFNQLGSKKVMVLATCSNDRVTARNMSCIMMEQKIYFQTDRRFLKTEQILKNQNVALCIDNIQLEGTARLLGHSKDNPKFSEVYKTHFKGSYETYAHLINEVVIEVDPTFITLWKYAGSHKPFRDFIDCRQKKAYRELYDISK